MKSFDVLVIGSGPGGEKAAMQASKLGKKVAVIEREPFIGGAGLHSGTIPSKTLRETALFLAGFRQRAVYGFQCILGRDVTLDELLHRKTEVIRRQMEVMVNQFTRNDIEIIYGEASFVNPTTLSVRHGSAQGEDLTAPVIVIASGTRPARPENVPFDAENVYDSDTILRLKKLPATLAIVGGGVIGCEYACIFAALGVKVTLIEKRAELLGTVDREIINNLVYWMRQHDITIRLSEEVVDIDVERAGRVTTRLRSGKVNVAEKLLYTMGRVGNTGALNLKTIGIGTHGRDLIKVNESYQTALSNVYAVGDVIGFPSLASTSREQGRRAVCHAFLSGAPGETACAVTGPLPYGIYTIPEISTIGATEEELTAGSVPYEVGTAFFHEVARGQIAGDTHGMLKIIFDRDTKAVLGVHIIGEKSSELIHIGQAVMVLGGTLEYFRDVVFNYPTFSDAYKVAALNGLNKL
jgi:NAD(P) transhydrogenase